MRVFTNITMPSAAWSLALVAAALVTAVVLTACDRRAAGEGGDLSPETGATSPVPSDTLPSDPASGTASTVMPPPPMTTPPPSASTLP